MNKFIFIEVNNNIKRFINKCNNYNIELYEVNYIDKDKIIVKIDKNDLKLIKRYNYYCDIDIYKLVGIDNIKNKVYEIKYFILLFICLLLLMYFVSNIILEVNVIHSNKIVRNLVKDELENYGIKNISYKKSFDELNKIKNSILENNKNSLEWLSITNKGMKVIVRVEERILDEVKTKKDYCNVVATKEGVITNIYSDAGEIIVNVNDNIKKDDILISGNIKNNEENKGYTCASGKVMGKVWYKTNITLERDYSKKVYTGKKRINFTINNKILRNTKFNKYDKKYYIKLPFFTLYKEVEYKLKDYKYSETESLKKALKEVDIKFKSKLGESGKILEKKILSKSINDKSITLNLFIVSEEIISKQVVLDIPKENIEE